jgi:hypothetical protein
MQLPIRDDFIVFPKNKRLEIVKGISREKFLTADSFFIHDPWP